MPAYKSFAKNQSYPRTDELHEKLLCVPLYADLAVHDIDQICDLVITALGEKG